MTIYHALTAIGAAIQELETAGGNVTDVTTQDGHVLIDDAVSLNCTVALPVMDESSSEVKLNVRESTLQTDGTLVLDLALSASVTDDEHDPSDSDGEGRPAVAGTDLDSEGTNTTPSIAPPDAESTSDSNSDAATESDPSPDHESATATVSEPETDESVPAYKDPEKLRAVYDECETFAEMTAVLGVEVTSETVRTHMINHGIHEPRSTHASESSSGGATPTPDTDSDEASGDDTESVSSTRGTDNATHKGEPETEPIEENTQQVPAGAKASADNEREPTENETGVVEEEIDAAANDEPIVIPDGIGLPGGVNCTDLAAVVSRASTVYEVHQQLDCDCDQAQIRQLLCDLGVIDLVTGRIATQAARDVPSEEVVTRIQHSLATGT